MRRTCARPNRGSSPRIASIAVLAVALLAASGAGVAWRAPSARAQEEATQEPQQEAAQQAQPHQEPTSRDEPIPPLPGEPARTEPRGQTAGRSRRITPDILLPPGFPPDTLNLRLAQALDGAGVDRSWLAPDQRAVAMWGGGEGRTPLYDFLVAAPERSPDVLRVLGASAIAAVGKASDLVLFAGQRAGYGVRRGLAESPHAGRWEATADGKAFEQAVRAIGEPRGEGGAKGSKGKGAKVDIRSEGTVQPDALHLAAFLLDAMRDALVWRDAALADLSRGGVDLDAAFPRLLRAYASGDSAADTVATRETESLLARIDLALLHAGGMDLALALDEARARADTLHLAGEYHLEAETHLGTVVLDGSRGTRYADPGPYLLIIDAGGHDSYGGGATTYSATTPVSVLFEMGGDDEYVAADSTRPSWGGACLGYGALVDLSGNDTYRGVTLSLGAAIAGVGILVDLAGDDRYEAVTFAEGAARHGVGVLGDRSGRDRYHAFQAAQGFGGPRGAGVLADSSGNDEYRAEDSVIRFPSAQTSQHNTSLAQGVGCGVRADYTDGHSLAGGVGILADGGGNDTYRCGVFGQGVGYWYGVGALFDAAGRDTFDGVWYAQGAAAHFAFGALLDCDGNDLYRATENMAQGAGHDFSVGLLLDYAGNDEHVAPNLSLGAGNANGIGIFFDDRGNDFYRSEGEITFGRADTAVPAGGLRDLFSTTGVFLDGGGLDEYLTNKAMVGDRKSWRQEGTKRPSLTTEIGVGSDQQ